MGRPSSYTEEIAKAICERLADGESLRKVCSTEGMPAATTVLLWADTNKEFAEQYATARRTGYLRLADEIIDIADNGKNDTYYDENDQQRVNQDVIARSRLRVDTRKWLLSKMLPKVYGDKLELAGDPERPLIATIERVLVRANTPDTDR
jgi:hypothetical protein